MICPDCKYYKAYAEELYSNQVDRDECVHPSNVKTQMEFSHIRGWYEYKRCIKTCKELNVGGCCLNFERKRTTFIERTFGG